MSPAKQKLKVTPELCEGCRPGHYDCERACKEDAIRVGKGFVYIDWERCNECLRCVEMCDAGALSARSDSQESGQSARVSTAARPASSTAIGGHDRSDRDPSVWTEIDGIIALAVMLASLFALNLVLGTRLVSLMPPSGRVFARAGGLAITYAIELTVVWLLAKRHGVGLARALGLRPVFRSFVSTLTSAGLVVAMLIGTRLLTTAYGVFTQAFDWTPVFDWNTDLTRVFGTGQVGLTLTIVLVVLFGPFVEEIAFRGVVQPAARRRWGPIVSIAATSALFAVYHFDPWMFAPTFLLGVALGWLAENRRGLWPSIALHVLYNGVTVFAIFWLAAQ